MFVRFLVRNFVTLEWTPIKGIQFFLCSFPAMLVKWFSSFCTHYVFYRIILEKMRSDQAMI